MRALGVTRVLLHCAAVGCGWEKTAGVSGWPDAVAVPDVGFKVTCPSCGAPEVDSRPDWPMRTGGMG